MNKMNLIKGFLFISLVIGAPIGWAQVENASPNDDVTSVPRMGSSNVNAPDHANGAIVAPNGSDPSTRGPDQSNALSTPTPTAPSTR